MNQNYCYVIFFFYLHFNPKKKKKKNIMKRTLGIFHSIESFLNIELQILGLHLASK